MDSCRGVFSHISLGLKRAISAGPASRLLSTCGTKATASTREHRLRIVLFRCKEFVAVRSSERAAASRGNCMERALPSGLRKL